MKAVEFQSTVEPGGHIALPPEIASEIPSGERLRVVIMWEASDFDLAWRALGHKRFEAAYSPAAYSPEDAVYERLMDDAGVR